MCLLIALVEKNQCAYMMTGSQSNIRQTRYNKYESLQNIIQYN